MRRMVVPEKILKSKIHNDKRKVDFDELEQYLKEDVVVIQVVANKIDIYTIESDHVLVIQDGSEGITYFIPNGAILTIQKRNDDIIVVTNILGDDDSNVSRELKIFSNITMSDLSINSNRPTTIFDVYIIEQD